VERAIYVGPRNRDVPGERRAGVLFDDDGEKSRGRSETEEEEEEEEEEGRAVRYGVGVRGSLLAERELRSGYFTSAWYFRNSRRLDYRRVRVI